MGDFGEEGAEGSEIGEERGEDVEDEDFGRETLGNKDLFFLGLEVGADLGGN